MLLSLQDVTKQYEGPRGIINALDSVTLDVEDGEFLTLLGPSGSGKTTLLHVVKGLVPKTSGQVLLRGDPVEGVCREMGMVFQDIALLPWRSVIENVEVGLEPREFRLGKKERRERAMAALERVGLAEWADSPPYRLSGGMQQRVGFARALAVEPAVLLLDEPFGQLDNFTRETLQVELEEICATLKITVMFVTHDVNEAMIMGDRVALFREGRLVKIADVPLSRPRGGMQALSDPRTTELRTTILRELRPEQARRAEPAGSGPD